VGVFVSAGRRLHSALFLLLLAAPADAQRLNFHNYTNVEGLPQKQVLAIYQDSTGYLWFGTHGGLSRYDGSEFRNYDTRNGLAANSINQITEDAKGRLSVSTRGGGICFKQEESFQCLRAGKGLLHDNVRGVELDADGSLWAATEGGVSHLGAQPRHYTISEGLPSNDCYRVKRDQAGQVWVGTARGLARLKGDRFLAVAPEVIGSRSVQALVPLGADLIVGTDSGLYLWRDEHLVPFSVEPPGTGDIVDATADGKGNIWFATRAEGVLRYDGKAFERLSTRQGLLADFTYSALVDREGDLWFGTDGGVSKLVPGPFVTYTEAEGLCNSFVRALGEDDRGQLWVGTRAGISIFDGSRFAHITTRNGLENDRISAFARLERGGMLVGTRNGLALWDGRIRRTYHVADGLPNDYVTGLTPGGGQTVWIGTSHGLARFEGGRITRFGDDPVLSSGYILAMKEDNLGRLWMGLRSGGAVIFDGEKTVRKVSGSGLTDQIIWSIDRDEQGRMWIGTNGHGVFVLDGDHVRHITTRDGLVNDFVWQLLCDSRTGVWLYTNRGLDRYDGQRFTHLGTGDGLLDLEGSTNAGWKHSNGELWFGSGSGLARYIPSRASRNVVAPRVVIEETTTPWALVKPGSEVPYDAGPLTFHFASLSFRVESDVRFRYRLRGIERAFSPPTADRRVVYGRLAPGPYELEVLGSNDDGVWSVKPAAFSFYVRPPWWQTWWFRGAMGVGLAAAVGGGFTRRMRRVEVERQRLEREVAVRTAELEEKNAQLRDIAIVDDLTRVYNRRYFIENLELELRKLSRTGGNLSLMITDLDRFKRVNDTHGHLVGDRVLAAVAERIQSCLRVTDLLARYGGEEFAVILPGTGAEGASVLARKMKSAIADRPFEIDGHTMSVTLSIGIGHVAELRDSAEAASRRLIEQADRALYRAKQKGRNRVEVFPEDGPEKGP